MSILVDFEIKTLCEHELITPFDPSLVNPASIDVRIGESAVIERGAEHVSDLKSMIINITKTSRLINKFFPFPDSAEDKGTWTDISLKNTTEKNPYYLKPKEFLLVSTLETFNVPNNITGEFKLKSSRAREGFENALAGFLDPGWHGSVLTLELVNNCRFHSLPIWYGRPIGQIIFQWCNPPERSYRDTGRYNNDTAVRRSRG